MNEPDAPRLIDLPGCLNMRDVGGYRTRAGAELAWRRLYRSGSVSGAMGSAATHLVQVVGLRRVIDLRTEGEVANWATPPLPAPCTRIHAPLFGTIRAEWVAPRDRSPQATASRYLEMLEEGAATVARVVDLLSTACTHPTVVHCAAGRDRTGIVIACVLDLLDVADATIAEDYALSDAVLDDGGQAHPDTIHCLLEMVRVRHGSTQAFLVERGMSEEAADRLAGALLAR